MPAGFLGDAVGSAVVAWASLGFETLFRFYWSLSGVGLASEYWVQPLEIVDLRYEVIRRKDFRSERSSKLSKSKIRCWSTCRDIEWF